MNQAPEIHQLRTMVYEQTSRKDLMNISPIGPEDDFPMDGDQLIVALNELGFMGVIGGDDERALMRYLRECNTTSLYRENSSADSQSSYMDFEVREKIGEPKRRVRFVKFPNHEFGVEYYFGISYPTEFVEFVKLVDNPELIDLNPPDNE